MDKDELNMYQTIPSPEAQKLLAQTGAEIKQQRQKETVPFADIMAIILLIENAESGEIYKKIGLSPRTFNEDKNRNTARLTTKYALLGLLAEQTKTTYYQFTHHELGIIFSALNQHIETRAAPYHQEVKDIQHLVMNMMMGKE